MLRHEHDEIDWERLDRLVRRAGLPGEQRSLAEWADADPRRAALAEAMRTIARPKPQSGFRPDARPALARVRQRLRSGSAGHTRHRA